MGSTSTEPRPDGRQVVRALLDRHPESGVGVFDQARNLADPSLLARAGIDIGEHPPLRAGALAEFVVGSDVGAVSEVAIAAIRDGAAERGVTLRSGRPAVLHLVKLDDPVVAFVFVIVPIPGDAVAELPAMTAIEASPRMGVFECDAFGTILQADDVALAMFGADRAAMEGSAVIETVHHDDRDAAVVNWVAGKERRGVALRWRCRVLHADGHVFWIEITLTNEIGDDGTGTVHLELFDVTTEIEAVDALAAERELLGLVTETLPVGVAKFDREGHVEHVNQQLARLLAPAAPADVLRAAVDGSLEPAALSAAFAALLREGEHGKVDVEISLGGRTRHLEWTLRAVIDGHGNVAGGVACVADVSESVELRAALEQRARTDLLTGCLNRAGTLEALARLLDETAGDVGVGLLFIDLDGFKSINDVYGHRTGDLVLEVVAQRLRAAARQRDVVGRLGGDEFVVAMPDVASADAALALGRRVVNLLCGTARVGEHTLDIAASVGVAWRAMSDPSELLSAADGAMYVAKQSRRLSPVLAG